MRLITNQAPVPANHLAGLLLVLPRASRETSQVRSTTTSTSTINNSRSRGTPATDPTEPLVAPSRAHHFRSGPLRASIRVARLPSSDLRNSLAVVLVNGPVAALAFLGTVPDPASATAGGAFFAAGGAVRRRDGYFSLGRGGRRTALGRGALIGLGACCAVGVDQSVLLRSFAHGAFAHGCFLYDLPGAKPKSGAALRTRRSDERLHRRVGSAVAVGSGARRALAAAMQLRDGECQTRVRSPEAIRRWRSSVGARFRGHAWGPMEA